MASTTQDELYQTFLAVSGQQTSALGDATSMLADVIAQVDELQSSNPAPVAATKTQSATTSSSGSGSTLGIGGIHGARERVRTGTFDQRAGQPF